MNPQNSGIVEEVDRQKAKLTFESAISSTQNLLTSKESNALALRYGLMGKENMRSVILLFASELLSLQPKS